MGKGKRYIKKSADGRFFLFIEKPTYPPIDIEKKTKLWLSSEYLLVESIKENHNLALEQMDDMIEWNRRNEKYEICSRLLGLREKYF
jgi:hypothetical protein